MSIPHESGQAFKRHEGARFISSECNGFVGQKGREAASFLFDEMCRRMTAEEFREVIVARLRSVL